MEPLLGVKAVNYYICPVCMEKSDSERDIKYCIRKHHLEELKKKVNYSWFSKTAMFETEEQMKDFANRLFSDDEKPSYIPDYDGPDYELKTTWTGPGRYTQHYRSVQTEGSGHYSGTDTRTYLWEKSIWQ